MAWLEGLDDAVADIERSWGIAVGRPFDGGTYSFVAEATMFDGTPAVLKLAMPSDTEGRAALPHEVRALLAADGRGCVRVLRHDLARGAVLLERLGRQLITLGLTVDAQLNAICTCLAALWASPPDSRLPSGADKAAVLAATTDRLWTELDDPCPREVIDHAIALNRRLADEFDPATAVLAHGDAHAWNTLEDPARPGSFKLVDADGLLAEREYDLSISLREYLDELLAGDPVERSRDRARRLAERTGCDPERICEWAYVEWVANGLSLLEGKNPVAGRNSLQIAAAWATMGR